MTEDDVQHLRSLLSRSAHCSHLMREAPFLVDKVLPFERNVVSLTDNLCGTLEEVRQAWPDVMFIVDRPEDVEEILITGDQHIRSIIRNLLHNAASYTPEEGSVKLTITEDQENIRLLVMDEGPGVDPADVDMIFAPLESMREGRRTGERVDYGMGVGLTISRAIARAYGGELLCHSNKETQGGEKTEEAKTALRRPPMEKHTLRLVSGIKGIEKESRGDFGKMARLIVGNQPEAAHDLAGALEKAAAAIRDELRAKAKKENKSNK